MSTITNFASELFSLLGIAPKSYLLNFPNLVWAMNLVTVYIS